MAFGLPSIGGKDSMSGSFNEIDVPPTLVSLAVDTANTDDIMTPELKQAGDILVLRIHAAGGDYGLFVAILKKYCLFQNLAHRRDLFPGAQGIQRSAVGGEDLVGFGSHHQIGGVTVEHPLQKVVKAVVDR